MVVMKNYVPDEGDIVWLEFSPQSGHEQAGRRPALVLSSAKYNSLTGLMLCCPMTTQIKGYPFEVKVPGLKDSVVLADHIKNQDWKSRKAQFKEKAPQFVMDEVRAKVITIIGCEWLLSDQTNNEVCSQ